MKQLLALLLLVPSLCLAQLPEFVSETGLIGWYGFNNNFNDSSLGDNHGVSSGASFTFDRFGEPNAAASIEVGSFIDLGMESNMVLTPQDSITLAFWSHPFNDEGSLVTKYQNFNGAGSSWYIRDALNGGVNAFGNGTSGTPNPTGYYNLCPNATSDWTHITVVFLGSQVTIWLNGTEVCTVTMPVSPSNSQPQPVLVGRSNCANGTNCNNAGSFAIDELGLWERALTAEEIQALFLANPLIYGCTDQDACNFQEEANVDDGSCYSCNVPAAHCGPGTHWDETLSACVADVPSTETVETCTLMSLQELTTGYLNLLEIVAYQDSLLAAEQGSANDGNVDGVTDNWNCGDPLTYWDYDYATVLIGDQCWFAKNLRTETYANGDAIPELHDPVSWSTTTNGAWCIYDNDPSNASNHGFLYNWWAHSDGRNVCPSGWHTPTNDAFNTLLSSTPSGQTQAHWLADDDDWNGQNDSNFSMLASGRRTDAGSFMNLGERGVFWGDEVTSVVCEFKGPVNNI